MTINCKGNLIDLNIPKVMGILNLTPDSFFDGGRYSDEKEVLERAETMLFEGASFIDVGAYSSRPGAAVVSEKQELERILPIIGLLQDEFPHSILSIDTFRSKVAHECLNAGAAIINDISAGKMDKDMMSVVASHQVPYIMMHMKGTPQTMQGETVYENLVTDILYHFSERIAVARAHRINDIILDPGFGFAKTLEQNYQLLQQLNLFQSMEVPILAGLSRKSMIYKVLGTDAERALNGTTALHMVALDRGAQILRAHDVREAMECIALKQALG
ncbi:MAG: dihydropteroate synthase [Sediminicola sp.]